MVKEIMEIICEFCLEQRATIYCKSDSARLCFRCDSHVHSANSLWRRHTRSLICDRCSSEPAVIRYSEEKLSVCQGCDWNADGMSSIVQKKQGLNSYTGCPTPAELAKLLLSYFDAPGSFDQNCITHCFDQGINELENFPMLESWMRPPPMMPKISNFHGGDQAAFIKEEANIPKVCSNLKDIGLQDGDLCEVRNMDVPLNSENCDEIFGCSFLACNTDLQNLQNPILTVGSCSLCSLVEVCFRHQCHYLAGVRLVPSFCCAC